MKINVHPLRDPEKAPDEDNPEIDLFTIDKWDFLVLICLLLILIGIPILNHIIYNWLWPCTPK